MPAATRLADICSGHGCHPPRPNNQASSNVYINSRLAHRKGDSWQTHTCGTDTHDGVTVSGSANIYINNQKAARIGDDISCGSVIAEGSPTVFFGDNVFTYPPATQMVISPVEAEKLTAYEELKINHANTPPRERRVTGYEHASVDSDDEGAPAEGGGTVTMTRKQVSVAATAQTENINIGTPPTVTDTAEVIPKVAVINSNYNFDDIEAATSFPESFHVSPNFTVGMLTSKARVSSYKLIAQFTNGQQYSEKDIVKNLRALAYNILEPLLAKYPGMIINSGFRHGCAKSQHERGQAADLAFPGLDTNSAAAYERAKEIANSDLPYDQFIFEQNNTIWFHLSYNPVKQTQRRMVMSKPRGVAVPYQGLTQVV